VFRSMSGYLCWWEITCPILGPWVVINLVHESCPSLSSPLQSNKFLSWDTCLFSFHVRCSIKEVANCTHSWKSFLKVSISSESLSRRVFSSSPLYVDDSVFIDLVPCRTIKGNGHYIQYSHGCKLAHEMVKSLWIAGEASFTGLSLFRW
jgi:hypothetical protein